ncbi:hypothetical protein BC833DRAFT_624558 [Globomyces pollinis-pini]|nr:hypothetical protein BC833DRAFT_624558 [Globomyces pollinis-pini]KAJ2991635.1 hypothetical protein HDV02_003661 [Globomyces sp. JEL0801]
MDPQLDEYKVLADIDNRAACPRCEGLGYVHSSVEKHDKAPTLRCKRCADCFVCDGSGVTMGVLKCKRCQAKGFIHKSNAPAPHKVSEFVKCFDCEECRDCNGKCVLDKARIEELRKFAHLQVKNRKANAKSTGGKAGPFIQLANKSLGPGLTVIPPLVPTNTPYGSGGFPFVPFIDPANLHPHMMGILGIPITEEVLKIMQQLTTGPGKEVDQRQQVLEMLAQKVKCPKCEGLGFKHESSTKHDRKPNERCKTCAVCKGCTGSGLVSGKQACSVCNMKGFNHQSTERSHDVPAHLRCFFCKDCYKCRGCGLEDVTEEMMFKRLAVPKTEALVKL